MSKQKELTQFLKTLKKYKYQLKRQELLTLRGQALNGDLVGAKKGFCVLMEGRKMQYE